MSGLSRGRNNDSSKSKWEQIKNTSSGSSDDDLIIIKYDKNDINVRSQNIVQENSCQHKKGKIYNIKKKQREHETLDLPVPNISQDLNVEAMKEDTLLELEKQLGRRLDETFSDEKAVEGLKTLTGPSVASSEDNSQMKPKVVCPFCWKKLNDKLTGTSHVKACGKNLPIERIFEAMQLHEKQVKEWEQIGISYPGFQGTNVAKFKAVVNENGDADIGRTDRGKANRGGGGKGGRRKKADNAKDPELDLALALSASLHEEFIERQKAELNHLVDAGLHNEVISKVSQASGVHTSEEVSNRPQARTTAEALADFRSRFSKETKSKLQKSSKASTSTSVVAKTYQQHIAPKSRRGKTKIDLTNTKLFTTSEAEKGIMVAEAVAQILDQSERQNAELKKPYKLNCDGLLLSTSSNDRLNAYRDNEPKLWQLSADMAGVPVNKFYTDALIKCKGKVESTLEYREVKPKQDTLTVPLKKSSISEGRDTATTFPPDSLNSVQLALQKQATPSVAAKARPSESFPNLTPSQNIVSQRQQLPKVCQDMLKLFTQKIGTDLTLYGREEKSIRVHKIILQARCPKLLQEIIVEESSSGRKSEKIPLTCFSHLAVKSFIWYLYCGQFPFASKDSEQVAHYLQEIEQLGQKYDFDLEEIRNKVKEKTSAEMESKEVQTELEISNSDKSVQTEFIVVKEAASAVNSRPSQIKAAEDLVENLSSDEDTKLNASLNSCIELLDIIENHSNRRKSTESLGSVDLFEDYENGDEKADPDDNGRISYSLISVNSSDDSIDNMLKKRGRSVSPVLERSILLGESPFEQANKKYKLDNINNGVKYNAEDAVEPEQELSLIKLNEFDRNSLPSQILNEICTPCISGLPRKNKRNLNTNEISISNFITSPISRHSFIENNFSRTSREKIRKSSGRVLQLSDSNKTTYRHSCSDPERSIPLSPQFSPIDTNHMISFQNCESDDPFIPFEQDIGENNDCVWDNNIGDSIFANIPDEDLDSNRISFQPHISNNTHSSEKLSPIPILPIPSALPVLNNKTSKSNAKSKCINNTKRCETKEVNQNVEKIKKHGRLHNSERNTYEQNLALFNTSGSHQVTPTGIAQSQATFRREQETNNSSPLLNYSTIDTPILKRELKRYGLKPLPRTKAKLLLRHIYKETH